MSHNTFGHLFRVTTWGESHGPAIGCVVDGTPPGLSLSEEDIQPFLDKRRPGGSRHVTQRKETDQVRILSGVHEGLTTGTPIALHIENVDARSKDYSAIAETYRPGHADYAYDAKYGRRDPRGGGRSSARETAMRVAAGAVARKILGPRIHIRAGLIQLGADRAAEAAWDEAVIDANDFFCPDGAAAERWANIMDGLRKDGSSTGGVARVRVSGVPVGLGAPLYGKLDADLAGAMMSINAAKGVEIGAGFAAAAMRGEDAADEMRMGARGPEFLSNHNGGVLGGISTGQDLVLEVAFKPTSSIRVPRRTITKSGEETTVETKGRHDPCVAIRAVPVVEAMAACVLADHLLRHRGQTGRGPLAEG